MSTPGQATPSASAAAPSQATGSSAAPATPTSPGMAPSAAPASATRTAPTAARPSTTPRLLRVLRGVARSNDLIPGIGRDAKSIKRRFNLCGRARRIGHQADLSTPAPKCLKRLNGRGICPDAIVNAAPKIAEQDVIIVRDFG